MLYASHVHFWGSSNRPIASTIESFEDRSGFLTHLPNNGGKKHEKGPHIILLMGYPLRSVDDVDELV